MSHSQNEMSHPAECYEVMELIDLVNFMKDPSSVEPKSNGKNLVIFVWKGLEVGFSLGIIRDNSHSEWKVAGAKFHLKKNPVDYIPFLTKEDWDDESKCGQIVAEV